MSNVTLLKKLGEMIKKMTEAWYKEKCPYCNTHNWICNGDESDLTSVDVDGIKCRKCRKIFSLGMDEKDILIFYGTTNLEDINWEEGLESPI